MNQTESEKYDDVPNYIEKKNLYRAKNSGLYLTLSELKNQKLQKDWINLVKNFMSIKKGNLEKACTLEKRFC